jgi:hypothetical protein
LIDHIHLHLLHQTGLAGLLLQGLFRPCRVVKVQFPSQHVTCPKQHLQKGFL